ncbi:hypothetical protein D3C71_1922300 [compost metagenome]
MFIDADKMRLVRALDGLAQIRLAVRRQGAALGMAHEVTHTLAGLKVARGFQVPKHLQGSGQADLVAAHHFAHRRHALPDLQCPYGHRSGVIGGDPLVKRQ